MFHQAELRQYGVFLFGDAGMCLTHQRFSLMNGGQAGKRGIDELLEPAGTHCLCGRLHVQEQDRARERGPE